MLCLRTFLTVAYCAATLSVVPALAAPEEAPSDVARLSIAEGDVQVSDGASGEWIKGVANAPLVAGDEVSTDGGARAEIQLDSSNIARLDENAQLKIAAFTREQVALEVSRGRMIYTVIGKPPIPIDIATPLARFRPSEGGLYTIDVAAGDATRIYIREGRGVVSTSSGEAEIFAGQSAVVDAADLGEIRVGVAPPVDAWENWADRRDGEIRAAQSWRNLNRNYAGAEDLDRHGAWRHAPEYGRVWVPHRVPPGWAPYRVGHWVWKPYWGWVWVSDEPWGWTPYHYGRWVFVDGYWAWWPGPVTVTYVPVWAPAYVVFLGFGHSHHPHHRIGWLPLGPADWYYPWWSRKNHARPVVVNNIHVTNIVNVTNVNVTKVVQGADVRAIRPLAPPHRGRFSTVERALDDARVRHAVSHVPGDDIGGRGQRPRAIDADGGSMRQANLMAGGPPALAGSSSERAVGRPAAPAAIRNETGVGRLGPSPQRAPQLDRPAERVPQQRPADRNPPARVGEREARPSADPDRASSIERRDNRPSFERRNEPRPDRGPESAKPSPGERRDLPSAGIDTRSAAPQNAPTPRIDAPTRVPENRPADRVPPRPEARTPDVRTAPPAASAPSPRVERERVNPPPQIHRGETRSVAPPVQRTPPARVEPRVEPRAEQRVAPAPQRAAPPPPRQQQQQPHQQQQKQQQQQQQQLRQQGRSAPDTQRGRP